MGKVKDPVQKGKLKIDPHYGLCRKQWPQSMKVAEQAKENAMIRDYQTLHPIKPKQ